MSDITTVTGTIVGDAILAALVMAAILVPVLRIWGRNVDKWAEAALAHGVAHQVAGEEHLNVLRALGATQDDYENAYRILAAGVTDRGVLTLCKVYARGAITTNDLHSLAHDGIALQLGPNHLQEDL